MAKSEHKRQQKLLKKQRRTSDLRKERNKSLNISNRDLILEAQKAPWLGCFLHEDSGMNSIFAIRQTRSGASASVFLIDMFCLGIKDAFFIKDFDMDAFRERQEQLNLKKVSPAHALKLISDAIDYAKSIGFAPHSQTAVCKLIFGDVDLSECTETFVFGKNGKPFYTQGPHDSRQRFTEILQTLSQLGEGNYSYMGLENSSEFLWDFEDAVLDDDFDLDGDLDEDFNADRLTAIEAPETIDADQSRQQP